ncbi:MAG: carboxylesterase family protein [Pseudomonadota bacterium]
MLRSMICAVLAVLTLSVTTARAQETRAQVHDGALRGVTQDGVRAFLGVPYAAPPVGPLRWRAPQPAAHWRGVRDATQFAPSCMQADSPNGYLPWTPEYYPHVGSSEDCLYLSIWTPSADAHARLPVILWIPGGAFRNGGSAVPVNNGAGLARQGIVVVTINYRVGAFGFLAHAALEHEADGTVGNYGFRDAIAALQWVRANIAAFGGDPRRVTVAGQSAGAQMVTALLTAPSARGLFVRAIAQSSPPGARPATDAAHALAWGAHFGEEMHASTAAALRALPADALLAASDRLGNFGPYVDGLLIPEAPGAAFHAGHDTDVPLLVGITAQEGRPSVTLDQYRHDAPQRAAVYPATNDEEAVEGVRSADRDVARLGLERLAAARARTGHAPLYLYIWSHAEPGPDAARYGAFHSSEMPYMFGSFGAAPARGFTDDDRAISARMLRYWSNFVKTGDPNDDALPAWPPADGGAPVFMELGEHWAPYAPKSAAQRALAEETLAAVPDVFAF